MARALEIPMYQLFYDGERPPSPPAIATDANGKAQWGSRGKDARFLHKFRGFLGKMDERDRGILLAVAQKAAQLNRNEVILIPRSRQSPKMPLLHR